MRLSSSVRGFGHRKPLAGTSWLWLIFLWWLSSRCIGEGYYNGFEYGVSGTNIIIAGYSGPAVALTIPSSIPGVNGTVTSILNSEDIGWSSALTNIAIPNSVTSIAAGAFSWCSRLTGFTVDTQNPSYSSLDGGRHSWAILNLLSFHRLRLVHSDLARIPRPTVSVPDEGTTTRPELDAQRWSRNADIQ